MFQSYEPRAWLGIVINLLQWMYGDVSRDGHHGEKAAVKSCAMSHETDFKADFIFISCRINVEVKFAMISLLSQSV
jgi:hypothetical protein